MSAASPLRALVVDADTETLAFAAGALNAFRPGFDVATASNLDQARCWIDVFHPDVLFLGLEPWQEALDALAARLAETSSGRPCKIFLCVRDRPFGPPPEIDARTRTILAKPLDLGELLTAVKELG